MVGENGIPETPDWMAQARPAITRLEGFTTADLICHECISHQLPIAERDIWDCDQG